MLNLLFPKHYFSTIQKKRYEALSPEESVHLSESFERFKALVTLWNSKDQSELELLESNEAQTKKEVIEPLLELLGYKKERWVMEESFSSQAQHFKLDYLFYANKSVLEKFRRLENFAPDSFVLLEAKAWNKELDTKRSHKDNPHYQMVRYQNFTTIAHGILTNGYTFRFYDHAQKSKQRAFYEVQLDDLVGGDAQYFYAYFYGVFGADTLLAQEKMASPYVEKIKSEIEQHKSAIQDKLSGILYGVGEEYQSVIETIGQHLYRAYPTGDLKDLFHNSLILIFRILFMASYESRYQHVLKQHEAYEKYSLLHYMTRAHRDRVWENPGTLLWLDLLTIFDYLDEGNERYHIPMLNGGLFNKDHAPLLNHNDLFQNKDLWKLLESLLIDRTSPTHQEDIVDAMYDFQSLDTTTFGQIYEASLSYDFRKAYERTYLVQYTEQSRLKTVTLDNHDYEKAEKLKYKNFKKLLEYRAGDLYLTSLSGERKRTGSYYTPEVLSQFLVRQGIESQLKAGKNPLDLKIIDNSCGSGHFLIYSLEYLAQKVQDILLLAEDASSSHPLYSVANSIRESIEAERGKITENITRVVEQYHPSLNPILLQETADEKIIRRLVLKRCLFGVDLQEVAVEITMISLWMETFIFATPLSFIEHHIKVGNSLLYTSIKEMEEKASLEKGGLWLNPQLEEYRKEIGSLLEKITHMQDTTIEEIKQSKETYYREIEPSMVQMREIFNYFFYEKWVTALYKNDPHRMVKANTPALRKNRWEEELQWIVGKGATLDTIKTLLIYEKETNVERWDKAVLGANGNIQKIREWVVKPEWKEKWDTLKAQTPLFKPFHIEIEFPDVLEGFDVVVGNPPWDKVKFEEDDFYSRLDTSYRQHKHQGKLEIRERYASIEWVEQLYVQEKTIELYNTYLWQQFPLAWGGHGNLFRYFVARNLELLGKNGSLSYITPSALMMENSSTTLRKHMLTHYTMEYFYQFQNHGKFPSIHAQFKFALWQLKNTPSLADAPIKTRFLQNDTAFLKEEESTNEKGEDIPYSLALIQKLSPEHWRFLELKAPLELALVTKAQSLFLPLTEEYIHFRLELTMTLDRDLFQELSLDDSTFDKAWRKEGLLPLYEGKMIHQYRAQYAKPTYWVAREAFEAKFKGRITKEPSQQGVQTQDEIQRELEKDVLWDYRQIRLACRKIARNTDERTIISSLVPAGVTFGHSLLMGVPLSLEQGLCIQAIFNSLTFDFLARLIVEMNVNKTHIMSLACPQPQPQELQQEPYASLVKNSATLQVLLNPELFPEIEKEFSIDPKAFPKTSAAREKLETNLRIQNDVLVAQLYQMTRDEMEYMLSTFPVFNRKNPHYVPLLLGEMVKSNPKKLSVEVDPKF